MYILRFIAFSKIFSIFLYPFFLFFSTLKNKPFRSRRSASGVKVKCIGGQGEVLQMNVWYSAEALLLDPWRTFPWPPAHFSSTPDALLLDLWRTSPWPGGLIFQSWKKQQKKMWQKNTKLLLKTLYILKYSYALLVKIQFSTWESL